MPKTSPLIQSFARRGAEARLAELQAEIQAIYRAFPDLRQSRHPALTGNSGQSAAASGKRPMSAAQRKAVSDRMKKYWAARRKGSQ